MLREGWGETVKVVLHHVPETEGFEGGFEVVTMTGVPHEVSVTGSDRDSAQGRSTTSWPGYEHSDFLAAWKSRMQRLPVASNATRFRLPPSRIAAHANRARGAY